MRLKKIYTEIAFEGKELPYDVIDDVKLTLNNKVLQTYRTGTWKETIPGDYVIEEPKLVNSKKYPDKIIIKIKLSNGKDLYAIKRNRFRENYHWFYDGEWYKDMYRFNDDETERLGARIRKDLQIDESVIKEWKNRRSDRIVRRAKELRIKTYDQLYELILDEFDNATGADVTIAAKELGISRFD